VEFLILLPFLVQVIVIAIDEFYFHIRRGLPKWERLGHPLDTLTVLICFSFIQFVPYSPFFLKIYIALAIFSCIFVTKDEFIHKECCPASEQWLHALLFINHPVVLTAAGLLWPVVSGAPVPSWISSLIPYADSLRSILFIQTVCVSAFLIYQTVYWNLICKHKDAAKANDLLPSNEGAAAEVYPAAAPSLEGKRSSRNLNNSAERGINNAFYEGLGEAWYEDELHPIALLRLENAARNPWIIEKIHRLRGSSCDVLDIGCGAGFLTNALAKNGHRVTGIDLSAKSLDVASKRDTSKTVRYMQLDAFALPFGEQSFDVICAMDFLEHVEMPAQIIRTASFLLRPNGLFFFHTFNRNYLSWLIVIKGVEWCVPNTPSNMHLYSYFIKPSELKHWCEDFELKVKEMRGLMPKITSMPFWKSLMQRKVDNRLQFRFCSSLKTGYLGFAQKHYTTRGYTELQ
jgi:2-polyprenyl-6-hydroxyphenyl methylase / 3-demethylubiquinone-9 3-methyltransferase